MSIWKKAIEDAVEKTRLNISRFGELFPHVSENEKYKLIPNNDWTNGFWTGILWLCYEYTKDDVFRDAAVKLQKTFEQRFENNSLDHHDIGFLYSLSTKARWIIERNEECRALTIKAADALMKRFRPKAKLIQAWGKEGDPQNGGRIIIDSLMNMPLLHWASEQTKDDRYREVAVIHTNKSRKYLVRGDDSSYHTFCFNPENGEPVCGQTHQGLHNGSTWTRGQAWGIYGFALAYHYTKDPLYLETSKRMAKYFLGRLPEDNVVYWDFDAEITPETKRDSSASAIAACGIHELLKHIPGNDPDYTYLEDGLLKSMTGLVEKYSTMDEPEAEGFIKHGSYAVLLNRNPDDFMIWGDYFYLEALMRLEKGHKGYWYE